jgi:hypothetical protein
MMQKAFETHMPEEAEEENSEGLCGFDIRFNGI